MGEGGGEAITKPTWDSGVGSGATPGDIPETHSWHHTPLLKPTPGQECDSGTGSGATPGATPEGHSGHQILLLTPFLARSGIQEFDLEPPLEPLLKPTPGAWSCFPEWALEPIFEPLLKPTPAASAHS